MANEGRKAATLQYDKGMTTARTTLIVDLEALQGMRLYAGHQLAHSRVQKDRAYWSGFMDGLDKREKLLKEAGK